MFPKTISTFSIIVLLFQNSGYGSVQKVTVDFTKENQIIHGFGGSSAWSGKMSEAAMDLVFGNKSDQLGYTILRLRIDPKGAWADEQANAKKAKALGATILASPWTPPASMKTNNSEIAGELKSASYADYAAFLKKYCDSAPEVDIMSIQNEPNIDVTYESCTWNGTQIMNFCKNHAASIGKPIMMPEAFNFSTTLSDPTLNDSVAASHIDYVGGHLYGANAFTYTKAINLKKHIWMTEFNQDDDSPGGCMTIAKQVLDCMYHGMNAYVYWWMPDWGNGLITTKGTLGTKKKAWVIAQFSKFVRPGYHRVDATYNPQNGIFAVAFKGNQQNVIVAINTSTSSKNQEFTIVGLTIKNIKKYTSSSSKNAKDEGEVEVTNNSFNVSLDAQSVTTFVTANPTSILPFKIEDQNFLTKEQRLIFVPDNLLPNSYLVNGQRMKCINKPGIKTPGLYILDGKTHIGIIAEKKLHGSN
jgi:glucuronoarabinoxylan endo-1,4-beta-xylanase